MRFTCHCGQEMIYDKPLDVYQCRKHGRPDEYLKQGIDWARKYNVIMTATYIGHSKHFTDDADTRDRYSISLAVGTGHPMTFEFGQSVSKSRLEEHSTGPGWKLIRRQIARQDGYSVVSWKHPNRYRIPPTIYDIIATLQKYDPGTFANFCSDFGYNTDSMKAHAAYLAVQNEYAAFANLCRAHPGMLEAAQEIN